jgi:hypothetical protein
MSDEPVQVHPLRYDTQPPAVSRRAFRFLLLLTLLNTIMLATFIVGPTAQTYARQQWAGGRVLEDSVKLDVSGPLQKLRRPPGRQMPAYPPAPSPAVRRARPSSAPPPASRAATNR